MVQSSSMFPCLFVRLSNQISTFFNIYRHKILVLTQFHLIPIGTKLLWPSTKLDWPSTTKYQPVQPHTDPAPPNTNQYCLLLTQYYHVSTSSAFYWPSNIIHQPVTAPYWPSTIMYQPVPPYSDNQKVWHFMEVELFAYSFFSRSTVTLFLLTWDEHICTLV